ncbi:DNA ligase 1-like [Helianthus annuus]|uniref:DNA ligase 1-like n=1 Tax=Helianthus annuus TaxID=4232 RepID=UPI000B8F30B2|nr:DNA ligase 1-like [Helianthus annuus]
MKKENRGYGDGQESDRTTPRSREFAEWKQEILMKLEHEIELLERESEGRQGETGEFENPMSSELILQETGESKKKDEEHEKDNAKKTEDDDKGKEDKENREKEREWEWLKEKENREKERGTKEDYKEDHGKEKDDEDAKETWNDHKEEEEENTGDNRSPTPVMKKKIDKNHNGLFFKDDTKIHDTKKRQIENESLIKRRKSAASVFDRNETVKQEKGMKRTVALIRQAKKRYCDRNRTFSDG